MSSNESQWPSRSRIPARLALIALLQGAAVLVIEVLGARMLTPYFGTSHYVWTAQITVTLVALTLGYTLGARTSSARRATVVRLGLLISGGYVGLTPLVAERISYFSYRVPLSLGAMLTSSLLFGVPLAALAAISPCLVGAAAEHEHDAGAVAGRMAAISTGGSVLGVLAVAYFCIPYLPASVTMYGLSALLLLCAIVAATNGRKSRTAIVGSVVLLVCVGASAYRDTRAARPRTGRFEEIDRAYSAYSTLQVWRSLSSNQRTLSTNLAFQNYYDAANKQGTDSFAYVLAELTRLHAPKASRAIIIGLGIGIVPRLLEQEGVRSEVFEIDPEMPALAAKYFDTDLTKLDLRIGDGRRLLREVQTPADIVLLDAFHGDSTPAHLLSREAFESMRAVMTPDGILATNMATDPDQPNQLLPVVVRTLRTVFAHVRVYDARLGNFYIVASKRTLGHDERARFDSARVPALLQAEVGAVLGSGADAAASPGLILTDDYNPADSLVARVSESERRLAASAARAR